MPCTRVDIVAAIMDFHPHNGVLVSDVGVLDKVMAILESFPNGVRRMDPPAMAKALGISTPTAYRLMKGMAAHGLLEQDVHGYRLGVTLLHLGSRVADGLDVRHVARAHMEWLRDQTSENAELHLRHGHNRVPIEVVPSPLNLRPMGQVGVPLPVYGGASAKVLLAWLEPDERATLALASHQRDGGDHPFDGATFERRLTATREQGYAVSDGEREPGVAAVAAPIRDRFGGVVAAMVLSAPSARLKKKAARNAGITATVEAAARVSRDLGHVDRDPARQSA